VRRHELDKLRRHSIQQLETLVKAAQEVISQKKAAPDELDIAREHACEPDLTAEVVETRKQGAGHTRELRRIYCSAQRCPRCPHGPYWYSIRENKRRRTRAVRFSGAPVFSRELIERIQQQARPPIAVFEIVARPRQGKTPGDGENKD